MTEPNLYADDANDLETLQNKVAQLEKQSGDYKMLIAEFENSRKRLAQDTERQRKYQYEPLVKDLLTALDNLDFAARAAQQTGDVSSLSKGVTATIAQFLDILKRYGVNRMEIGAGSKFDPNLHQAVMEQPTNDHAPGEIVSIMQQGFTLHDRVIRPASVIVASTPPAGAQIS